MNPTNSADALSQLQQAQSQAQNPNDILTAQRQQLGVNGAQDTVTGLRGAINNTTKLLQQVAPSVMGRTGSSLVTNAQATRQIGNEQAPISQKLTQESTDYNQANQDLAGLQQRAQEAATGIYTGQQNKLSYAQNLYNTLYQKEQDAQAAQQAEADRQEKIREFNASQANSGGSSFTLPGATSATPAGLPQGMTLKNAQAGGAGGYNFTFGGNPVSAATFAQLSGQKPEDVIYSMAQSGDKTAATAYQDMVTHNNHTMGYWAAKYPSLFWSK